MSEFLAEINWSPLWISLKTGFAATVIAFFLGIFFARLVMKMKPVSRGILDGILTMPLVLPPTVAGFILLLIFSLRRPFGAFLLDTFDIKIVQTWKGCVIAASVIAFLHLPEQSESMVPHPCLQETSLARPEQFLLPLQQRPHQETMEWPVSG